MKLSVKLILPEPLSLNRAYRTVQGRILISKAGREYKSAVAWTVAACKVKFGDRRLAVCMTVHFSNRRRHDADNTFKLILDAMADGGLYDDDSQIDDLRFIRGEVDKANPRTEVVVTEI
jgi:crossover junction endodeoxyribonuclease RusA